jgi:hypothetical protein
VTEPADFRRVELALALLGLSAAIAAVVVTLDAIRFHAGTLLAAFAGRPLDSPVEDVAMLALAGAGSAAVAVALCSATRQLIAQRARVRGLHRLGTTTVDGREVVVVRGVRPVAFCSGLLRPRIFVSQGALRRLSAPQLRAVIAHEAHHADRRDPLRLLIGQAVTSSLRPIPAVGALGSRQAVLAEIAADAAAVRVLGSAAPLAGALLAFDDEHASGVTPERVDHLLGERAHVRVPPALIALSGLCLGALLGIGILLSTLPVHPVVTIAAAPVCVAAVFAVTAPAWLAGRRLWQSPRDD